MHALGVILHDAVHLPLRRHGTKVRLLELRPRVPAGSLRRRPSTVTGARRSTRTIFATTRDHLPALPGRWMLWPRNIGYHLVHHLHPQVTLTALPKLRRWYLERVPDYPR